MRLVRRLIDGIDIVGTLILLVGLIILGGADALRRVDEREDSGR